MPRPPYPSLWQIAEGFRRAVLIVLGVIACFMGAMIVADAPTSGPSFRLFAELPGWPSTWGAALALSGLVQLVALASHRRLLGLLGCSFSALWYLSFASTFIIQWLQWVTSDREHADPSIYPFVPYLGFVALHVIAVVSLWLHWVISRREGQ